MKEFLTDTIDISLFFAFVYWSAQVIERLNT